MSFDFMKTLKLIQGGLLDHTATWNDYLGTNPGWKDTAIVLTAPLLVANIVLSLIFSRMTGGFASYGYSSNFFMALVMGLIMAAIGFVVAVFVFNFLAGTFKGKPDFNRAFAAVSLAAIPAWIWPMSVSSTRARTWTELKSAIFINSVPPPTSMVGEEMT